MKKNKLWLLLKMQYKATMRLSTSDAKAQKKREAALERGEEAPVVKKDAGSTGYTVMMTVVGVLVVVVVVAFSLLMGMGLGAVGMLDLMPAVFMMAASVMALITTIYKTNGLLFGFKDYDLIMSLPVKTSTIIASRLMILYFMNLMFTALLMLPSSVVYAILANPPIAFWPIMIICLLMVPLVPVVLATIVGSIISWVSSHFKRKNGANIVFTLIALFAWMLFCMNMNGVAENIALYGDTIMNTLYGIYPLTRLYMEAVTQFNVLSFLLFALISLGAFALFAVVVSKFFIRLNSAITANRTKSNYKMQALKITSPKKSLLKKEFKRITSSSNYMLNSCMGLIMAVVASALVLIIGPMQALSFVGYDRILEQVNFSGTLASLASMALSFFAVLTCPSAASISIEGKSLWIMKSLPVKARDIIMSKLKVNLILVAVAIVISATLLNIALKPDPLHAILLYLTPLVYGLFTSFAGISLNLKYPNFNWNNELEVIKRGKPMSIMVMVGMVITMVPGFIMLFTGGNSIIQYIITAVLAVICLLLYRNLVTKGIARFESYEA